MSAYSPASEVILRHSDEFTHRRVLFAGDLQDMLPAQLEAEQVKVWCNQYHHWRQLTTSLEAKAVFSLLPEADFVADCDALIYYWPKSKQEAQFQLQVLLSLLPAECDIFIVGENRSGVRSAEQLFESYGAMNKIDSARRCGLYYGKVDNRPNFDLAQWWHSYTSHELVIKALPGVFSRDELDVGSRLLLDVLLQKEMNGDVLDIGCGSGVLSAVLKKQFPAINLTLADVSATALESSKATFASNNLSASYFASDVFSDIQGRFNYIISNPPFHDGVQTSLSAAENLIRQAKNHLQLGGVLCIVANAFLPYPELLDQTFGSHEVLVQNGRFKVYQAVLQRPGVVKHSKKPASKR